MNELEQRMAALEVAVGRLAAIAQQATEPQSSVELSRNAKGETQITVKVYDADPDVASGTAQSLYDSLCRQYAPKAGAS